MHVLELLKIQIFILGSLKPPLTIEGISQLLSNWEILIEIQTHAAEIQAQAVEAQA